MSRLLITNLKECDEKCPFYDGIWDKGKWIYKNNGKCTLSSEEGIEIKELEADGFPKFCGLEKVKKDD